MGRNQESGPVSLSFLMEMNMTDGHKPGWNRSMQKMFGSISRRYDLLNTLMSLGRDRAWRRFALDAAAPPEDGALLDIGTGTGKIAAEAKARHPGLLVAAADLTPAMMRVGKDALRGLDISWINADALMLPFGDESFDVVTSGFLMRNVPDIKKAFIEQLRVVKQGGRVVCLDTSPPRSHILKPLILLHFRVIIPLMGGLLTGQWDAYRYLPRSTESFKTAEELARIMEDAGFEHIAFHSFMFGTMTVITGVRPGGSECHHRMGA